MALAINIVLGANTVHFSRNIQKATQNAKKYLQGFALLAYMQAADKDKSVQDYSMACNYNTRPRPCEVMVNHGTHRLIRKREALDDLWKDELI